MATRARGDSAGRGRRGWLAASGALAALGMAAALAFAATSAESAGRTPRPVLDAPKGEKCVEDTALMRRAHMRMLEHHRDDTVHRGIRTTRHSLAGCVECHAGGPRNSVIGSETSFCQGCHTYSAVRLDCFECHASSPRAAK